MARPAASAASITLSSRIEPPGWMTAVAPASAAAKSPSGKGKKASEATTDPASGVRKYPEPRPCPRPFARRCALNRHDSSARHRCLRCTVLEHRRWHSISHVWRRSRRIAYPAPHSVGARLVTTRRSPPGCCHCPCPAKESHPPPAAQSDPPLSDRQPAGSQKAQVLLFAKISTASSSASGAITTSVKISEIAAAVAASSRWFSAMMPPKADVRSQSKARV